MGIIVAAPKALTLVSEEILLADAQRFTDVSVDGNTQAGFLIEFACYNAKSSGDDLLYLRLNGATTLGSRQGMTGQAAVVSASESASTGVWIDLLSGGWTAGDISIPRAGASALTRVIFGQTKISNGSLNHIGVHLATPASNVAITSIGLESNEANGLKAGSMFRVWRKG